MNRARREINKARGSYSYGLVPKEQRHFGACDFEINKSKRLVEPRPEIRGNIARAMLYMRERYGLTIFRRLGRVLQQWNREDPPDSEERRRHEAIATLQGTRNRFIDHPEAADRLHF